MILVLPQVWQGGEASQKPCGAKRRARDDLRPRRRVAEMQHEGTRTAAAAVTGVSSATTTTTSCSAMRCCERACFSLVFGTLGQAKLGSFCVTKRRVSFA